MLAYDSACLALFHLLIIPAHDLVPLLANAGFFVLGGFGRFGRQHFGARLLRPPAGVVHQPLERRALM